jgi:hypothetical protein
VTRRIWCEALPAGELGAPATQRLLLQRRIQPLIALPPAAETAAMAASLRALSSAGVAVGLWPLLTDQEGYWAGINNAQAYRRRVRAAIDFAEHSGARVATLAIDLEPPLALTRQFLDHGRAAAALLASAREGASPKAWQRRARARHTFQAIRRDLAERGIETFAAVIPPLILDLGKRRGRPLQAMFGAPIEPPCWDRICPMLYGSMIAKLVRAPLEPLLYGLARSLVKAVGSARAAAAVGLVGPGKLGDEAAHQSPAELAADVAAIRAAGIEDLALFSLEAVLARPEPEAWLAALDAPPKIPTGHAAALGALELLALGSRLIGALLPHPGLRSSSS